MKKLIIPAALLLLLVSRRSEAQTLTIITDSLPITEIPESYFYKRTDGYLIAVSFKIMGNDGGKGKLLLKYTSPAATVVKPSFIKMKFGNGQAAVCRLTFLRKGLNDNKDLCDNLFFVNLNQSVVRQLQTLGIQSIAFLSAQQILLTEIPVSDSGNLQQHMLKLGVLNAN